MKHNTDYFEGRENRELFYQCWLPENEIKAYIIAIHGWATHSDRMKYPAEYFTDKGYAIYSFDLRGHWRNKGEFPGHIDSMDHLQKDIVLFMDIVKKDAGGKKIFLMGHSFGGLISLIYGINHPDLTGLLISSPQLGVGIKLSMGKKFAKKLSGPMSKVAPTKVVEMIIEQNQLTSDLKILREHIADKNKLEIISIKTAAEMESSIKWALKNASKLMCPVLIMQAGNDKIVDGEKTKNFFNNVDSEDKTYKEYDGFLHELWNEKGRAQVFQDMFIWLEKHL
ncbi:MAG: alpha/beta hydrolase [Candidatus Hermodarchaeota archaeon]